jgi:predicted negative regulator of RcsB-dependent stress response
MDRQQRHDLKHDKFVDEIGVLSGKARDNQRLLYTIGAALIALAVIIYGVYFFRSSRETKAQGELATAIQTFDAPVGDAPPDQQQNQTGPRFKTEDERNTAAEKQFKDVQAHYGSTDAADVAGLYLARLDANRGNIKAARTQLEEFIGDHKDHILVGTARFSLYQLRLENGEASQVVAELNTELAKPKPDLPGDSILVLLAQAYDVQGDATKAREAYRRITTEYPDSPYIVDAQRRVGA